ncbi:MAG: FtsQ-type POTRA domain-containing protein [bacterium]
MVIFKKKRGSFRSGGYQQYRGPSVFNASKKTKSKLNFRISKLFWKLSFFFIVIMALLYIVFCSKVFLVTDIFIEGNNLSSSDLIKSKIPENLNILLLNESEIQEKILKEIPEIKSAEIYRGIPNAIKIVVLEREGKMIWQSNNIKYLVSSQGEVSRQVNDGEQFNLPVVNDAKNLAVSPGESLVSPNFVAFIINIYDNFFTETNIKPTTFEIQDTTFDVNLQTEAGFYVKFNSLRSSKKQLDNLKIVLAEKRQDIKEYIDLRIDGWAYYK